MRYVAAVFCCVWSLVACAEWQADAAAKNVAGLSANLEELIGIAEQEQGQPDAVQNKNYHAALVDLRLLVEELDRLDLALAAGKDRVQTYAIYQNITNLRESVRDYAQDTEASEVIRGKAETVRKLLRELDLLYVE